MNWTVIATVAQILSTLAVVYSVIYLARQAKVANQLARAEASRGPNSDLSSLNATFGTNAEFRTAMRQVVAGATREQIDQDLRMVLDFYMLSLTNVQVQLVREIRVGTLGPDAQNFGGSGVFTLPYYKTSWPLYRVFLSSTFAKEFEAHFKLDSAVEADW